MSEKPQSGDTFRQLKELMLGDEQEAIEDLRSRLDGIDTYSVERLAADIAEVLHRRQSMGKEEFDVWVAALQESTEAAIQRSVTTDKSRLSGILFPIMGPAIRNYTVDLFRRMGQELNETIRNTTSAKRIWWRVQARMAGKPYSEFVMLKTRAFSIEEVYLMQRDTGLLLLHAAANPDEEANDEADLVSGMFTAIRSFVRDSFAESDSEGDDDGEELDGFTFGEREVLIELGPSMALAAVAHGVPPPSVRDDLKAIVEDLHSEVGGELDASFNGDMTRMEPFRPTLRTALIENRVKSSESGGGAWRVWLFLSLLLIGVGAWIFFGAREQGRWNRFEEALRDEPGIAVTGVEPDGFWRHRRVRGLRDPDATNPDEMAGRFEVDLGKTTFDFDLMESLDPAIADRRKTRLDEERRKVLEQFEELRRSVELAATGESLADLNSRLKSALESLEKSEGERRAMDEDVQNSRRILTGLIRSQFADVEGLEVEFKEGTIRFYGEVPEPDYSSLLRQIAPLSEVMSVDTDGLKDGTSARLKSLERAIREVAILFLSGSRNREDDAKVELLVKHIADLDRIAELAGRRYRLIVEAHPLIGANREANRKVEQTRLERARDLLIAGGIESSRIEIRLSEDSTKAGAGISVLPIEVELELR